MTLFSLTILTPEKDFFADNVGEFIFPTPEGRLGVMAGHAPMIAAVAEGIIEIFTNDECKVAAVGQGFCEIEYDRAEFYLDTAEWAAEIDATRAREALERAKRRIQSNLSRLDSIRSQAAIHRAMARIKAAETAASRGR